MAPGVWRSVRGAHPRSRGDHTRRSRSRRCWLGSSLLAQGPRGARYRNSCGMGLIPARAGTTAGRVFRGFPPRAHPRSRGDHLHPFLPCFYAWGSSPLARGPLQPRHVIPRFGGLIPARAGTTLADMGFYPLHQQNRITLKPEPKSRIHDKQLLLTTTSTAILTRLTPP